MMAESHDLTTLSPADRHRAVAGSFLGLVESISDPSSPSPVAEWTAGDIVTHLLDWFPGFLAAGGVELRSAGRITGDGLAAAWAERRAEVQALFDDDGTAGRTFIHPLAGTHVLSDAIDRFYTADVFMHSWDLARAVGGDDHLDPVWSRELLEGLRPIERVLRSSGQYGPAVDVDPNADVVEQLMGFIGRDPHWTLRTRRPTAGENENG